MDWNLDDQGEKGGFPDATLEADNAGPAIIRLFQTEDLSALGNVDAVGQNFRKLYATRVAASDLAATSRPVAHSWKGVRSQILVVADIGRLQSVKAALISAAFCENLRDPALPQWFYQTPPEASHR